MSKDVLEALLILDFQARETGRRFQYATYGPLAPKSGRTIKEYAVRPAPSTQVAAGLTGPASPSFLVPPQYGAYFCSEYARATQTIWHQPENSQSRWLRG